MTPAAGALNRSSARGTRRAILAVLVGLLAVLLAGGYFFARSASLEEAQALGQSDAIARGVASSILAREEGYMKVLQSYAGRFRLQEAVKRKDRAEAAVHLRQLSESFPEMDGAFLADPAGVLWARYPESPELYGKRFAYRDWYQGVSREWRPYVSEVFVTAANQAPGIALVLPIRDPDGNVIGIIGSSQRLDVVRQWLLPIQVPNGDLYLVDRKGQLIFHRSRVGREHLSDYARVPEVERLLKGEEGVAETKNPVDGEVRLTAFRRLPSLGWGLVVYQEKNLALQRVRRLMLMSGVAGLLLAGALAMLGGVALRNRQQTERAVAALGEKTWQLQEAQEELVRKERLAILGQLAGGVSHELKNPLGVIKNSVYYLKMVLPEEDRVKKHLQILEREVGTANRIVTDLLDFARVKPPLRVPADLSGLVRETLERTPQSENVEVVLNLADNLPPISVDPDQVQQVLGNLITNAAQAMPEGGTLTIETARDGGGALVAVSDTGVGIPPEHLAKIFQPLFTTKARGIGLGLAVVKSLAEANGGEMSLKSVAGRGSRFVVRFETREEG